LEIKKILIKTTCILILMGSLNSFGQENRLSPCVDFGDEINQIKKYNRHLEEVLVNNFKEDYIVRFIAKPTSNPEYAFQIREIDTANFEITAVFFQENLWNTLWNTQSIDSVIVEVRNRNLNKKLALKIDALFNVFTKSLSDRNTLGIGEDDISYIFIRKSKNGVKCGETLSPNEPSPLGELIYICNVLTEYVKEEDVEVVKVQEIINKLYDIIK